MNELIMIEEMREGIFRVEERLTSGEKRPAPYLELEQNKYCGHLFIVDVVAATAQLDRSIAHTESLRKTNAPRNPPREHQSKNKTPQGRNDTGNGSSSSSHTP